MSIRQGILALLSEQPMYGAQLRSEFETRTGGTWPLNVGQVYSTLNRLERDGMVEHGATDPEGKIAYRITPAGRTEVQRWWSAPVERDATPPRGELVIKFALAVSLPGVDVLDVVQTQRTASVSYLQDLTRLKRDAPQPRTGLGSKNSGHIPDGARGPVLHRRAEDGLAADAGPDPDLAWSLVLDNLIFAAEAELRWLDHVEGRLKREAHRRRRIDERSAYRIDRPGADLTGPAASR
jgi:DNA-binding PadR family transcriptional regulator